MSDQQRSDDDAEGRPMPKPLVLVVLRSVSPRWSASAQRQGRRRAVARGDHHAALAPATRYLGDVAQLAEHRLCKAGVESSILFVSTR